MAKYIPEDFDTVHPVGFRQLEISSSDSLSNYIKQIEYKFNEGPLLEELKRYVDSTYGQHYATDKIQATEMIIDMGDGIGFCRGNIFKYAKRYGKKAGHNRDDLLKVLHYALMLLHVHDINEANS